jgi:hypothetical protein
MRIDVWFNRLGKVVRYSRITARCEMVCRRSWNGQPVDNVAGDAVG